MFNQSHLDNQDREKEEQLYSMLTDLDGYEVLGEYKIMLLRLHALYSKYPPIERIRLMSDSTKRNASKAQIQTFNLALREFVRDNKHLFNLSQEEKKLLTEILGELKTIEP